MEALRYESLLRWAFGFARNGRMLDRWEDPAGMANAGEFSAGNLDTVKAGTAYAMEIFTRAVIKHHSGRGTLSDAEYGRLQAFTSSVINAPDMATVGQLIKDYRDTVQDVYFVAEDGNISLK
jgi:hypothetical protein